MGAIGTPIFARRSIPERATIKEVVPSYEGSEYQCALVPAATPKAVVEELYRKSVAALDTPDMHRQFREKGGAVALLRPDELKALMEADQERIRNATRLADIAPA